MTDLVLPSGNSLCADTWAMIREAGTWRGYLDARMYPTEDLDWLERLASSGTVVAELAPLGVPLWPTVPPRAGQDPDEHSRHFTLTSVSVVRTEDGCGDYVQWTYRDGCTRSFRRGEPVVADPQLD